uniref:ATP synthase CF1 delta subunit n=2 Tax=Gracilariopsis TaxID=2781 RepID=A0A1C9CEY2_9FLOR|nr:ATP synthase CF1 delta chain [Gracilariopsis lemaneiformis]YP_009294644.1 ATP synthase CF1 delta subunit [Gracilariopsis chorda]AJO68485.1 ATP synthase CF1 delta subunit [Gracilariopsis lemaneiformis]AML79781.1 ATP synthase CF1 delta chain [Gracilariopsis lemaneiformis]AOM66904.1 ATP synthase CF1 delta subunit [Gracilariopsis chorda]UAD88835.1 ATP synthase CF1 subunit delta [Gracilariopsis chorda]
MSNQGVMSKVAMPYAEALIESARDSAILDQINQDLSLVSNILKKSEELKIFFDNPSITVEIKKNVVNKVFSNQVHDIVLKFLLVLIDRRRISVLDLIINKYLDLVYQLESTVVAEISTPIVLTDVQETELINKIKHMSCSKTVKLVTKLNPDLIAGFIVKIGSKTIDTSLQGKLIHMTTYLNSA